MKDSTPSTGMNRTGVQMSPFDISEMTSVSSPSSTPVASDGDAALAQARASCIADADTVGSIPMPGTVKGAVKSGASMLTGANPQLLLDKLGERLAFERTGTRLYDALIAKFDVVQDRPSGMTIQDLREIREAEARHFALIKGAIEHLGGDPTSQTPCADVAGVEALGLMQVVTDARTTLAQSLHAILVAELTDNNAWEMLIALADDNGHSELIADFTAALNEERTHLARVQSWFEEATAGKAIGIAARGTGAAQLH